MRGFNSGFTLIELMVVIAIMAILVVIALPSYNTYNSSQKLAEAANQLQTVLRQAQNNAQTGTGCRNNSITYNASKWTITLTLNSSNYTVTPTCDFSGFVGSPTPTPISQVNQFPAGITITGVELVDLPNLDNSCPATIPTTIDYKNLLSDVIFNISGCSRGVTAPNVALRITLTLGSNTKTVVVEKGGGIYVSGQ